MKMMRMHKIERDPMELGETNPVFERGLLLILEGSSDRFAITNGVVAFTELSPLVGEPGHPTDF